MQTLSGIHVDVAEWDREGLPAHLRMRFEILGTDGQVLGAGHDLDGLKSLAVGRHQDHIWHAAREKWEKEGLTHWDFGDLPDRVELEQDALGVIRYAYPALVAEGPTAAIRLFPDPEQARENSRGGLLVLYQHAFAAELKQLLRSWLLPGDLEGALFFMGGRETANRSLQDYLLQELFGLRGEIEPNQQEFLKTIDNLRGRLALLGRQIFDEVLQGVRARHEAGAMLRRLLEMGSRNRAAVNCLQALLNELDAIMPGDFLKHSPRAFIQQLPRYLQALQIRGERAYAAPEKDRAKAEHLAPHQERYSDHARNVGLTTERREAQISGRISSHAGRIQDQPVCPGSQDPISSLRQAVGCHVAGLGEVGGGKCRMKTLLTQPAALQAAHYACALGAKQPGIFGTGER